MRANTDRAAGVRLVTDPVQATATASPIEHLDFEVDLVDDNDIVALNGRITAGLGVQLLWQPSTGKTFITLALDGETETFEVPSGAAQDAFLHPFAYGGSLL